MPRRGIPVALIKGEWAIQRICKKKSVAYRCRVQAAKSAMVK